ncbi:DUF4435 domain-containing protein [Streptomyces virginiae]|uniref:hypothetical protein n=1 Tax=Streptomyces virginiae TaxID=1961 RepID=UPI0032563546
MDKAISMREMDRVADRIRLHRQSDKRPVVIVEGPSDQRMLSRAFSDQDFSYFSAGTRSLAINAAITLAGWGQRSMACVVDRDFDDVVMEAAKESQSVHAYENADMEAMLLVSRVGADLLQELGSIGKIETQGGAPAIISRIFEILEPVSRLRRANSENSWGIAFDAVDLASKIDKKEMALKIHSYCMALHQKSSTSPGVKVLEAYADGSRKINSQPVCPRGSSPYFRGRDFLAALGVALCGYCGSKRPQSVPVDGLEESLRLAGAYEIRSHPWSDDLLKILQHQHH